MITRKQMTAGGAAVVVAVGGGLAANHYSGGNPHSIGQPAVAFGQTLPILTKTAIVTGCLTIPGKVITAKRVTTSTVKGIVYTQTINPIWRYRGGTLNPTRWEHVCIRHPVKGGTVARVTVNTTP